MTIKLDANKIKFYSQIGTRATFGLACIELLKSYENLMICTADVSTSAGLDRFRKKFPNNYVDVGIAEQNLIGVATGLSDLDFKVITTTFSPFQTLRCLEQIKVNLKKVRQSIDALAFVVNVYSSHANFSSITNSYVRLFDPKTKHEFARLTLGGHIKSRGVIFCIVYRGQAGKPWTLLSCGEECEGRTCKDVTTKLWDGSLNKPRGAMRAAETRTPAGCCNIS